MYIILFHRLLCCIRLSDKIIKMTNAVIAEQFQPFSFGVVVNFEGNIDKLNIKQINFENKKFEHPCWPQETTEYTFKIHWIKIVIKISVNLIVYILNSRGHTVIPMVLQFYLLFNTC